MKKLSNDYLITRYMDDTISDEEMAKLNQLLINSPKARQEFNQYTEQAMVLAQGAPTGESKKTIYFPKKLAAVAALVLLGAYLFVFMRSSKPMAEVVDSGGKVEISLGKEISSGDTLKTIGTNSFLDFEFSDGTKVRLGGNTIATVTDDNRKLILVHEGSASLDVEPQKKESPLILITPTAELTVLGTSFGVFSTEGATRLEVAEGEVDLKRLHDDQSVRVKAGEYSVANSDKSTLGAKPIPELNSLWSVDFRQTTAKNIGIGVQKFEPAFKAAEVISSYNAWELGNYGLFRVVEDSILKVRLKMDEPGWLNFIVNYRSPEVGSNDVRICIYQDQVEKINPGEWVTVELPLSKPIKCRDYEGELDGLPIGWNSFRVSVSAGKEKRGLVIEKMWTE